MENANKLKQKKTRQSQSFDGLLRIYSRGFLKDVFGNDSAARYKWFVPKPLVHRDCMIVTQHIVGIVRYDSTVGEQVARYICNALGERLMVMVKDNDVTAVQG